MRPRDYLRRKEKALRRSARSDAERLVAGVDDRLDLSARVREHPWIGLGSGVLAGCAVGALLAPVSAGGVLRGAVRRSLGFASAVLLRDLARDVAPAEEGPEA